MLYKLLESERVCSGICKNGIPLKKSIFLVLLQLKNGIWKISELHLYLRIINANRVQRVLF